MEVYLLDVGQGTSQIILHGGRSAIVVDCGTPNDRIALQFLKRYGVEYISRLIISHSHDDHIGGAVGILAEYQDRIGKIFFVQDHRFLASEFWLRTSALLKSKVLKKTQLKRLERSERPQVVWKDPPRDAQLLTYSPNTAENLLAQEAKDQNPTSAVLFFDCGKNRIIFASDSEMSQWDEIYQRAQRTFQCKVLAVAHHGGLVHQTPRQLQDLFNKILRPEVAVISVGTSNIDNHPREDVIAALKSIGAKILCTQITKKCCKKLEPLRPGVLQPVNFLGRSVPTRDMTASMNSRNVACAGTVQVRISKSRVEIDRLNDHQAAVDKLAASGPGCPLCR